jgi:hypothetical protein
MEGKEMTDNLTIESYRELLKQYGGEIHGPHVETVSISETGFFAYSQALEARVTAKTQEYCDYLRNKLAEAEQRHLRDKAELAGCQEMLKQKDEALSGLLKAHRITVSRVTPDTVYEAEAKLDAIRGAVKAAEDALALTSPTAALEAVRAEDKAEIEWLTKSYSNMKSVAQEGSRKIEELDREVDALKIKNEQLSASNARMAGLLKDAAKPRATQEMADKGMCAQWDVDALAALSTYDPAWLEADRAEVRRKALEECKTLFCFENGWGEWSVQHAHRDIDCLMAKEG